MDYRYSVRLKNYRWQVDTALEVGEGLSLRQEREKLAALDLSAGERAELAEIDAGALEFLMDLDYVAPYLLADDPTQPLEYWWWHLGKLRAGHYPAEYLPEHLRPLYRPAARAA
ncbi:hypothetical protein [Methylomagnum sp.]